MFELGDGRDQRAPGGLVALEQAGLGELPGRVLDLAEKFRADAVGDARLDGGLLLASLLAMELSILVRFALNDAWTFRGRGGSSFVTRLVQSNVSSLGSPVIALGCLNLMTPLLGISYLIANSLGIALGLAWNWAWSSRVIWRLEATTEPAPLPTLIEETR